MNWEVLKEKLINSKHYYWHTDNGVLLKGDCLEVMKKLPKECIDLVITSPPYNVGIDYDKWNDKLHPNKYFKFVKSFLLLFKKVLKFDGRFAINIPYDSNMKHIGKMYRVSLFGEYYNLLKEVGLNFYTVIDLNETSAQRSKLTAWGSWLSPSSPYIYNPKECVLIGYNKQWKKINKGESDLTKNEFIKYVSGIWDYFPQTKKYTKANYSLDIPIPSIKIMSCINDIILDPFIGSGTTALACEKLNRRWIGIEISEEYCETAKQRLLGDL